MKNALTSRIIGGQVAPSPIPWQAHLHYDNNYQCGATIIDEETVLTTSFCVIDAFSNPLELLDKALLEIEAGVVSHGDVRAQIRGISEIIIHPCNRRATVPIDRYVMIKSIQILKKGTTVVCILVRTASFPRF